MLERGRSHRTGSRALVVAAALLLVLVFVLALLERDGGGLACDATVAEPAPNVVERARVDPVPPLASTIAPTPPPSSPAEDGAFVSGRVVTRREGTGVPMIDVIVGEGVWLERVTTDCDGRFTTTRRQPFGALSLEVLGEDARDARRTVRHGAHPKVHEIRVESPSRLWIDAIDGASPDLSAGWSVRVVDDDVPPGIAGVLAVNGDGIAPGLRPDPLVGDWLPLRRCGVDTFVRLEPDARARTDVPVRRVQVRSAHLGRRGQASIESSGGRVFVRDVVTHAFTLVTGALGSDSEQGRGVRALVRAIEPSPGEVPEFLEFHVGASPGVATPFEFEVAGSGEHELVLWNARAPVTRLGFHAAGSPIRLEPVWMDRAPEGTRGGLRVLAQAPDAAPPRGAVRIGLRGFDESAPRWVLPLVDGVARVDDLPLGSFEVSAVGVEGPPPFLDVQHDVSFDGPVAHVVSTSGLVPRIATIEPAAIGGIPTGGITAATGPCGSSVWAPRSGTSLAWPTWSGAPFAVTVWAVGFRPVRVRPEEFLAIGPRDVASVRLERGFGLELHVRWRERRAGTMGRPCAWAPFDVLPGVNPALLAAGRLPGVRARVAGRDVGRSDADGRLGLALDSAPRQIELVANGWRVSEVWRPSPDSPQYFVWMEREP